MKQMIVNFNRKKGEWRWNLMDASNHKILGASTEGYKNLLDMQENFKRITGLGIIFNPLPKQDHVAVVVDR